MLTVPLIRRDLVRIHGQLANIFTDPHGRGPTVEIERAKLVVLLAATEELAKLIETIPEHDDSDEDSPNKKKRLK
jgi:hypothetical protein